MEIAVRKNGQLVLGFVKKGRFNYAQLEDGSEIPSSSLGEVSIECSECSKQSTLGWRTGLLKKAYLCQSCSKLGARNGFFGRVHTDQTKKKKSLQMKGRYAGEANPFFGKKHTEETKSKIRESQPCTRGAKNSFFGRTHTEEAKRKIVEANRRYQESLTPAQKLEISKKLSKAQKKLQEKDPERYLENKRKAAHISIESQARYKMNKLETKVYQVLQSHFAGLFEYSVILGHQQFDFGCKRHRILIEVQGDYWHGNPSMFGEGADKRPLNKTQKLKKAHDVVKADWCRDHNFTLLTFWESDINADPSIIQKGVQNAVEVQAGRDRNS